MDTVTIERAGPGQAIAIVGGARFEARFDATLRRWRVMRVRGPVSERRARLAPGRQI